MFSAVSLITWRADADRDAAVQRIEGLAASLEPLAWSLAPALPASRGAGDLVWRALFPDEAAWRGCGGETVLDRLEGDAAVAVLDAAAYTVQGLGVRGPQLAEGVYRALFISVASGTPAEVEQRFCADLAAMPRHIPEILNWALSPVLHSRGGRRWSHVWEQEFAREQDLTGAYMAHPYHWAHVDRWFDPEMPEQIVQATAIRHSASGLAHSLFGRFDAALAGGQP